MLRTSGLRTLLLCGVAMACSKSSSDEGVRPEPVRKPARVDASRLAVAKEPKEHRAKAEPCPKSALVDAHKRSLPEPGTPCKSSIDCTAKKNGRCTADSTCAYDECYVDGDCGDKGRICVCDEEGSEGYRCLAGGDCRVDSDCAEGEYCSPSFDNTCGPYHGVVGYFCHTRKDECRDDQECQKDHSFGYCAYMPEVGHWACGHAMCKG